LRHTFGGEPEVAEVRGRYVRPPRIVALKHEAVGQKPFVDLVAEIASPLTPLADYVRVRVNGKSVSFASVDIAEGKASGHWRLRIKQVPLHAERGKETLNRIALSVT